MPREYFKGTWQEQRAYSPAIKLKGGTTIYLAGVGGATDKDGKNLADDFPGQVRVCFEQLQENLARAGGTLDDIATMTVFITDMRYGTLFTELRRQYFQRGYPCSALIGVKSLARAEMLVEIQAIAVVGEE